jgi:membrane protease YdiL (CAAX protease family)
MEPLAQPETQPEDSPAQAPPPSAETEPQRGWRPWTAWVALLSGLVLAAVGGLIVDIPAAVLFGVNISHTLPGGLEIADTVVQDAGFIAVAVFFAGLGGRTVRAWQFGLRPAPLWRCVGAVVLTIIAFFVFTGLWSALVEVSEKEKLLEQLGSEKSTALLLASALLTCVIAPICEEFLFRGFFFTALSNWRGWLPAAVITGLVFGSIHAGSAPVVDLVPLAALGFALCVLYRRTGSLYPCIAAHVLNNSLAFGSLEGWGWQTLLLMICALTLVAALALALRRVGVITDPPTAPASGVSVAS